MNAYQADVEARGYGDTEAETEALIVALTGMELDDEVAWSVMADPEREMLLVQLKMDGVNALDVHDLVFQLWQDAWGEAFPEQAPTELLSVKCVPVSVRAAA